MTKAEIIESIKSNQATLNGLQRGIIAELSPRMQKVLREAAELLKTAPEWISVDDRLPERNTRVLVYAQGKEDGFEGEYVITITSYTDNLFGYNISGWVEPWQYFFVSYEITHWMPLPEPPTKNNGGENCGNQADPV